MYLAVLLAATMTAPTAPPRARSVLVLNVGNDALFTLRVGNASLAQWGEDLLGFDDVIDVSRGRTIVLPVDPAQCREDLQATFRGGVTVVVPHVNVCTVDRLEIGNQ